MDALHRPVAGDYGPYYSGYVSLVPESDVFAVMRAQQEEIRALAAACSPEQERLRYAAGKWSVREVLGHVTDAERIFAYRLLCIGRGDRASLPGFDEGEYMAHSKFDQRPLAELVQEFDTARRGTLDVMRSFDDDAWKRIGTANATPTAAHALPWIMAGHVRHHLGVLRERYGLAVASERGKV